MRQAADPMALIAPMQGRSGQMRKAGLQTVQTFPSRSNVCRRNATHTASSALVKTVDRFSFGPMGASVRCIRFFHLATVLELIP
jgi:hypothetical protein